MNTQPEALRLADAIDSRDIVSESDVAAELRRLCQSEREGWRYADELEQERKRLHALNQELLEALKVAACEIADWGSYASEYFQNKHDLQGAISRLNAIIAKGTGES